MSERGAFETSSVLVVGGGFAGVAAAWAVARAGVQVVLVQHRAGASALYSGAVDGPPPTAEVRELGRALGLSVDASPRAIATREGSVRSVRGRDTALLDLESLAGARIAVADIGRDDWDASLLSRSYASATWARRSGTSFAAIAVAALREGSERRIAPYDLALRFDVPARAEQLTQALRTAAPTVDAWLLGPWLGVQSDLALGLSAALGCPVGETASQPGGNAGARFELKRGELLRALGVPTLTARVLGVAPAGGVFQVELEGGARLETRAVVLALGGVAAGGIELQQVPGTQGACFRLSLQSAARLELDAELLDAGSSLAGVSFQRVGLGALDRVGIHVNGGGRADSLPLFACGDVLAGRPRTVLAALTSGIDAGRSAVASL